MKCSFITAVLNFTVVLLKIQS